MKTPVDFPSLSERPGPASGLQGALPQGTRSDLIPTPLSLSPGCSQTGLLAAPQTHTACIRWAFLPTLYVAILMLSWSERNIRISAKCRLFSEYSQVPLYETAALPKPSTTHVRSLSPFPTLILSVIPVPIVKVVSALFSARTVFAYHNRQ